MTTFRMAFLNPESYSIPKNGFHCNSISRIADRLKIWDPGCPQGQKWFHPMSERVIGEGFLPKNATWWLHSCWIRTQDDIIIAIEPLESLVGLKLMFWNIPGVKNIFTPGIKLYLAGVLFPKMLPGDPSATGVNSQKPKSKQRAWPVSYTHLTLPTNREV